MQNQKTNFLLPLIIISNLVPLYGVLKFNWSIFSIVYIYWLELLIISFFQLLKILFSQGDHKATIFTKTGIAIKFFLFRTGVFLFYLLFIIVFLGFLVTGHEKLTGTGIGQTILLRNPFFNVVLMNFFAYNLIEFIVVFIYMRQYTVSLPYDHFTIFDSHMIVVHIVVVLGSFLYEFILKRFHAEHRDAMIACVCLFITVKIIVDIARQNMRGNEPPEVAGKYI
jgi:hypothetical protein